MKFYGEPNMGVFEVVRKKNGMRKVKRELVFRFDENGEYVTNDEMLIKRLVRKFEHDDNDNIVEVTADKVGDNKEQVEVKLRKCKKCDFACESQGELLKHYRENHPKGGVASGGNS